MGYPRGTGLRTPPSWRGLSFETESPRDQFAKHHRLSPARMGCLVAAPDIRAANAQSRNGSFHPFNLQEHPIFLSGLKPRQSLDDEVVSVAGVADVATPGADGVEYRGEVEREVVALSTEYAWIVGSAVRGVCGLAAGTGFGKCMRHEPNADMNKQLFQFERNALQRCGIHCPAMHAADAYAFTMS